ncbi:MAG TPA: TlpA disulfide reductase family protein [Candidatus Angelobacter sp.]|nr:TlpA disulfide reductase family protein [Candidatus Angelobacter sp.]
MAAIEAGVAAPEIKLPLVDGREFSLSQARKRGPVVIAFFKVNCPVCQFTFPYLERIYKTYSGNARFTFVCVSQNDAADTEEFNRQFGVTFPTLLDDARKYPASNAYGLTNVPSIFLVTPEGEVELSSVGWSKQDMEELNRRLAEISGSTPARLFKPGEQVPDYKPG